MHYDCEHSSTIYVTLLGIVTDTKAYFSKVETVSTKMNHHLKEALLPAAGSTVSI
jgi:hypothetical protein